ncbi:MAG: ABC transporter ATP-binding protein [Eubacteriales bacterium]|nr:ABC transporter ATP-binding protein [Eubacteriales bacterium]
MKKLYKYLKPYMLFTVLAPLFMIGEVIADLMQPTFMSSIINEGIVNGDTHYILITCLKMIGVALLGVVGGLGNMYFSTKAGFGFAKNMRQALYEKVQSFSFANIDQFKTGSLVTRITNDVTQIQNAFTSCIRMMVRSPFLCIGGVIAIASINMRLAMVVFCTLPVLAVAIGFIMKKAFPLFRQMQEKLDRVNVVMQENLAGVRVIKAFGRSDYEKKRFRTANNDMTDLGIKASSIMAVSFPLFNLIMNICMILVYWFGGDMVFSGELGTGDIMAFSNYVMQILMSLTSSSFMFLFLSRATVSVQRVNEVLDTKSDITDGENKTAQVTEGKVEFRGVSFRYPGQAGDPVLNNISFTAEPGETVAILGSTGSGKSSLISLIPRLYDATKGEVLVDERSVKEYTLDNLRGAVGIALQESMLFTGTIDENLRWGDEDADQAYIEQCARVAQADGFVTKSENGYETVLGQGGVNLSGGQKQRLCIARALVKKPKILILDDSTSAVDLTTEAEIQKGLREIMGHITVFIIAQRISSVMDADKIIVMDNGAIADIGTHEELKKRCEVYREIVISQLGKEAA